MTPQRGSLAVVDVGGPGGGEVVVNRDPAKGRVDTITCPGGVNDSVVAIIQQTAHP